MKVQEDSEKVGLKLNIQKPKIMASIPTNLWQKDGESRETMRKIFLAGRAPNSLWMVTAPMKLQHTCSLEENV